MQAQFLNQLDNDVQVLVRQIEEAIGIDINVVVDPERAMGEADEPAPLASDVSQHGADIFTSALDYFPDASVFHELQHIRRVLVERTPRLIVCEEFEPWSPEFETAIAQLDNNLEHLFIVPAEIDLYPQRRVYWEQRLDALLGRVRNEAFQDADRHRFALLGWLLINNMVPTPALQERERALLREYNLEMRAAQFRESVEAVGSSKEDVVRVVFEFLSLPFGAGCLQYFDVAACTSKIVPLQHG